MSLVRKDETFPLSEPRSSDERPGKLFDLLNKGDERAYAFFYDATKGLVFGILLHILNHTEIAEAVFPELYSEVKRKAIHFRKQADHPLTWLVLIVHRKGVERLCRELDIQAVRLQPGQETHFVTNRPFINITEQRRVIRTNINLMPSSERRMLELAFFSGMSNLEIATELGVSCTSVDASLRAATTQVFCVVKSLRFSPRGTQSGSATEVFFES